MCLSTKVRFNYYKMSGFKMFQIDGFGRLFSPFSLSPKIPFNLGVNRYIPVSNGADHNGLYGFLSKDFIGYAPFSLKDGYKVITKCLFREVQYFGVTCDVPSIIANVVIIDITSYHDEVESLINQGVKFNEEFLKIFHNDDPNKCLQVALYEFWQKKNQSDPTLYDLTNQKVSV